MRFLKKQTKRIVALLLMLLVLTGTLPLSVSAAEIDSNGNETNGSARVGAGEESPNNIVFSNDLNGWKVKSTWSDLSDTYVWNAETNTSHQVKMIVTYRLNTSEKDYAPNDIVFTVPGIGNANRASVLKATGVAGGEADTEWNYTYDKSTDTYTFKNKYEIRTGQSTSGGFEIVWSLNSRTTSNGYEQTKSVGFTDGDGSITLPPLTFRFTSKRDKEIVTLEKESLNGEEYEKFNRDYVWYKFYNNYTEIQNARGLYKSSYNVTLTLPEGTSINDVKIYDAVNYTDMKTNFSRLTPINAIETEDGKYKFALRDKTYGSLREFQRNSFVIGFKKSSLENKSVTISGHLDCLFYDEEEWTTQPSEGEVYDVEDYFTVMSYGFAMPSGRIFADKDTVDYTKTPYTSRYNSNNIFNNGKVTFKLKGGVKKDYNPSSKAGASVGAGEADMGIYTNGDMVIGDNQLAVVLKDGRIRDLADSEYHFYEVRLPTFDSKRYELYVAYRQNEVYENYVLYNSGTLNRENKIRFTDDRVKALYIKIIGIDDAFTYEPTVKIAFHLDSEAELNKPTNDQIDTQQYVANFLFMRYFAERNGHIEDIVNTDFYDGTYGNILRQKDIATFGKVVYRDSAELWLRNAIVNLTSDTLVYGFQDAENHGFTSLIESEGTIQAEDSGELKKFSMITAFPSQLKINLNKANITISGSVNAPHPLSHYVTFNKYNKNGKTYIVADFDFTANPLDLKDFASFKISYPVSLNYFDYADYGSYYSAETFVVIQDEGAALMQMSANNLAYDIEDFDNDGNTDERGAYSTNSKEIVERAREWREYTLKGVKSYYTETFDKEAVTRKYVASEPDFKVLSEYKYRLSFGVGQDNAKNIIFYDDLENGAIVYNGNESQSISSEWKGSFVGVDTSHAEQQGMIPTVYYTTVSNASRNTQSADWTTTIPNNLATVKGIAVKLDTTNLEQGALKGGQATYVEIKMLASPNDSDVGKKAVNQFYVSYDSYDSDDEFEQSYELPSAETYVSLMANVGQKTLRKVDLDAPVYGNDGSVTYERLAGASINIYNSNQERINDTPIALGTTAEYRLLDVEFGTYYWEEVSAPDGYQRVDGLHAFTVNSYRNDIEIIGNHRIPGTLSFYKKDADSKVPYISGAKYELYNSSDELVYTNLNNEYSEASDATKCEFTTGAAGSPVVITNLPWGKYYLKEKTAPQGYMISDKKHSFTFSKDNLVVAIETEDREVRSTAILIKLDSVTNKPIKDAKFVLEKYSDGEWHNLYVDALKTNSVGEATAENLLFGHYRWREYIAPVGYEPCEPVEFVIDANNAGTITTQVYDDEKEGTAKLRKTSTDGKPLKGAVYSLYKSNNELVKDGLFTDSYGETPSVEGLAWGDYYFKEDKAPNGYVLSNEKIEFTINARTSEYTQVVSATNEKKLGSVKLIKTNKYTDENDKILLQGAVFSLYKGNDTLVQNNLTTNANGELTVSNLDWGSYYFVETQAPSGYSVNPSKIKFSINASNASVLQVVSCVDDQGLCEIKVNKEINEQHESFGGATFIFTVEGTDLQNKPHKYVKSLTVPSGEITGSVVFAGIPHGTYTVSEKEVARYKQSRISPVTSNIRTRRISVDGKQKAVVVTDLTSDNYAEFKFINRITQYEKLNHNGTVINVINKSRTLVGLTVDYIGANPIKATDKSSYTFKSSDLVITANYDNDTTETVDFSDVVLSPATVTADDNAGGVGYTVTASYTENGITVSDSFNVQLELKEYATKKQLIFDANGGFFADTNSSFNELSCYAKDSNTDCIMSGQYKPATDQYRTFINWYSTPNCQDGTEVVVNVIPETDSSDAIITLTNLSGARLPFTDNTVLYAKWSNLYCYSSLALATSDANNLTTENSDMGSVEGAVAVLNIVDDTAYIKLVDDSINTPALVIDSKVELDLNDKTLEFAGTNGITYNSDLTITNGNVSGVAQNSFVSQGNNTNASLTLNDVTMDIEVDGSAASNNLRVFNLTNGEINIDNSTINATIVNDQSSKTYKVISQSQSSTNSITNSSINISADELSNEPIHGSVYAMQLEGDTEFINSSMNITLDTNATVRQRIYGLYCGGTLDVEGSTFAMDITATGSKQILTGAVVSTDASATKQMTVKDTSVLIDYDTTSTGSDTIYAVYKPFGGPVDIEDSNITVNVVADGSNVPAPKFAYGFKTTGDDDSTQITSINNNVHLDCHLTAERTDSSNKIYLYGYWIDTANLSSTSDVFNCTTDTIHNNVIYSNTLYLVNSESSEIDNIYAFVTSQPSYNPDSTGASACIGFKNSTVNITDNNGTNYVHGSHSGISASGDNMHLTVHGGTYESPAHGGFYLSGGENSSFIIDGVNSLNTQNFNEHFETGILDNHGAFYISDSANSVDITNSYIYGGKFGLRIKYNDTSRKVDVNVDDTYIYGDYVGIHDDMFPGMGVLTVGENTTIEIGGLDPERAYDIWTWRGADVVDNRPSP